MSSGDDDQPIQTTQWTNSLLQDLCAALKGKRDDQTVRAFAKELMEEKDLPISYLVRKVTASVGPAEAERLDVLLRGRHAVEKDRQARATEQKSKRGVKGLLRRFLK